MSGHAILLTPNWQGRGIGVICSCGELRKDVQQTAVWLDEINTIAHDHIESSERVAEVDAVTTGHGGYRVESLVRSADELIDLEHP